MSEDYSPARDSICRLCGVEIVGSASGTLPKDEEEHLRNYLKAGLARAAGRAANRAMIDWIAKCGR